MDNHHICYTKKRSANWTEEQTMYLVQLVNERRGIIKGKFSPGLTIKDKRAAWIEIAEKLNEMYPNTVRTVPQCEKRWYNVQMRGKAELYARKRTITTTAGDSLQVPSPSPIAEVVGDILGHGEVIQGIRNSHVPQYHLNKCMRYIPEDVLNITLPVEGGVEKEEPVEMLEDDPLDLTAPPSASPLMPPTSTSPSLPPSSTTPSLPQPSTSPLSAPHSVSPGVVNPEEFARSWGGAQSQKRDKLIDETLLAMKESYTSNCKLNMLKQENVRLQNQKLKLEIEYLQLQVKKTKKEIYMSLFPP